MLPSVLSNSLRLRLFGLLVLSGLALSAALALLFTLARAVTTSTQASHDGYFWLGVVAGLALLSWGRFFERYGAEIVAQSYVLEIRQLVLDHALRLPTRYNGRVNKGGTLLRLTGDMSAIRNWIVQGMAPLVVLGTWLLASLTALSLVHWSLALAACLPLVLAVAVNYLLGRQLYRVSETARRKRTQMIRNVNEKLAAINVVRSFNQLGRESRRFERQGQSLTTVLNRRAKVSGLMRGGNEALMLVTLLALVLRGQTLISEALITREDFALTLIAAIYLLANLRRLSRIYELWTLKKVAEDKLESFLALKTRQGAKKRRNLRRSNTSVLSVEGVAIPGRLAPVSATLHTGDRAVLSGSGGVGKSTLLKLIAGLEHPLHGKISLSGIAQSAVDPSVWSKQVALVSNELPLLRGSIHSNLAYGRRRFEEDYYQQVLELCGLEQLIETGERAQITLSEGGTNLSSSDRYRLMLARALLRRPQYLLIDSHEAHLDNDIIKILIGVMQQFPGAVLLCSNLTELEPDCTQRWILSGEEGFSMRRFENGVQYGLGSEANAS